MFLYIFFVVFLDKMILFFLVNIINYIKFIKDGFSVEYYLLILYKNVIDWCMIFGVKYYDMNRFELIVYLIMM